MFASRRLLVVRPDRNVLTTARFFSSAPEASTPSPKLAPLPAWKGRKRFFKRVTPVPHDDGVGFGIKLDNKVITTPNRNKLEVRAWWHACIHTYIHTYIHMCALCFECETRTPVCPLYASQHMQSGSLAIYPAKQLTTCSIYPATPHTIAQIPTEPLAVSVALEWDSQVRCPHCKCKGSFVCFVLMWKLGRCTSRVVAATTHNTTARDMYHTFSFRFEAHASFQRFGRIRLV
jgi:hypothetical protein